MFQLSANARLSCLLAGAMLFLGACAETPNPAPELVAATPIQPPQNQQSPAQAQAAAPADNLTLAQKSSNVHLQPPVAVCDWVILRWKNSAPGLFPENCGRK